MAKIEPKPIPVRIDSKGRIILPAAYRKQMGLEAGDTLFAQSIGRTLRLSKPEDPIYLLWQHAEKELAEGRTISLEEFAKHEGVSLEKTDD